MANDDDDDADANVDCDKSALFFFSLFQSRPPSSSKPNYNRQ